MLRPVLSLLVVCLAGGLVVAETALDQPALVNGPDIVTGEMTALQQFGSSGTQVGLSAGPTSCNAGNVEINFFVMPNTDHPVIVQNLYRMSGGATNQERFEQIGQSWVKHTFGADQFNICGYGCTPAANFTKLGAGCSDTYDASTGAGPGGLGSRAWIHPYTGAFSSGAADHTGHTHTGTSHRLLVERADLNPSLNVGANYYLEEQYITPHEYAWCQAHPGECNMYNNVSYRQFGVSGTTTFAFSPLAATVRERPAVFAWTGANIQRFEPKPGVDGIGYIAWKVTGPIDGVWHYEYAIYNESLNRAIQSFTVPLGCGVTASNVGFHAPPQHPGFPNDGTVGNTGYSNLAWTTNQTASSITWATETFAQNENANAIRWGTLYNFRFDSNRPPASATATLGFFKTGFPLMVTVAAPTPDSCAPLQMTAAASRFTHGGAGSFDIALAMGGTPTTEPRDGAGNHTLVFGFSNQVVSGTAAINSGTAALAGSPSFSGNTMTVNLTGVSDAQTVTLTLSGVTDATSQVMPDTPVAISFLLGDSSDDRAVNSGDALQTRNRSGQATGSVNVRSDVNADGSINAADATIVRSRSGMFVP